MNVDITAGKGGVGKTTCAVSYALHLAHQGKRVAVIDYDGGHSVKNTLGIKKNVPPNDLYRINSNLSIFIVENVEFVTIAEAKKKSWKLRDYLEQFEHDLGMIPLVDMVNTFFGVPTDVPALQKFLILVMALVDLRDQGFEHVIIDVEPTAGFERLLSNTDSTTRSLRNLQHQGAVSLLAIGAKWPDLKGFIQGEYIKRVHVYTERIQEVATLLRRATYLIVTTPEASPVSQTFEVRKIIEKFGGKVKGVVVNNIRGEGHEAVNIERLEDHNVPLVKIERQNSLHTLRGIHEVLGDIGGQIAREIQ